jgi:hypothetical protein
MKNRNWLCYVIDSVGITALIIAAIALATALWFNAIVGEALLCSAFSYSLMAAVGAFLPGPNVRAPLSGHRQPGRPECLPAAAFLPIRG